MTSAINGRIIYKQGTREWLDENIRPNSLVFDLTNNLLMYSPSGTTYYEFYPGQTSGGSVSALQWNNILNKPVASVSTSGVLTNSDWVLFNGKADVSAIPVTSGFALNASLSNYYPISSTGNISGLTSPAQIQINSLSSTVSQLVATSGSGISAVTWNIIQNVPIASVSTSGILTSSDYNKFNNKADVSAIPVTSGFALNTSLSNYYPTSSTGNISGLTSPAQTQINSLSSTVGQLVSTSGISAVAWSIIQNVPVASLSTSGVLTSSDYNKFNNKADVSAIPVTSAYLPLSGGTLTGQLKGTSVSTSGNISANNFYGNISSTNLTNILYQTLTLTDSLSSTVSATSSDFVSFSSNLIPNVINFVVSGGSSGTYAANYNIYTTLDNLTLTKIAYGTITSANNIDSNSLINLYRYNKFASDVSISGTPSSKVTIFVKS